jgi:UDP-galactopyranose mutase
VDRCFDHRLGRLRYRTLDFEEIRASGDYQGTAVMNYCDEAVPFNRISEAKHFAPWEAAGFADTICHREYSRDCGPRDVRYYPVRLARDTGLLAEYVALARQTAGMSFLGRLGTYRYLDMDKTIGEALRAGRMAGEMLRTGTALPAFFDSPLA